MAAPSMHLFSFLYLLTVSMLESSSDQAPSLRRPHLTGCVSANMETFRCRWSVGAFLNVSEPGDLRLFYVNMKPSASSASNWSECPHYSTESPNECFFNKNHTSIWTSYSVQLCSRDRTVLYDENLFHVQDIVQPDPPTGLNWTLLNMSFTGFYFDVMLSWKPPESADVKMGWMTLEYEVQYRDVSSDHWETTDVVKSTHRSLYGFQTNTNHEVRVRCKMFGGKEFGEFSDSVFINVPTEVPRFPVMALLIFGALCLVAILMLVFISRQDKLMVVLLPPVPGPKIRGIDPELLKKGKLRELTSILGVHPDLRPELYNSDPWVEFIDLDIEEQNERLTDLDTDCLMDGALTSNCSPLSIGFRDDDSGRASCCDPDLPSDPEASPFQPHIPTLSKEVSVSHSTASDAQQVQGCGTDGHLVVAPSREALYAQVSEVRSSGKVLLSPEELQEKHPNEDQESKELKLCVVNAEQRDYTSEVNPKLPTGGLTEHHPRATDGPLSPHQGSLCYTLVEGVGRQNSLLLTPNLKPASHLIIPKTIPTPNGYLTPDLLGSITP
ncbi:growth hormone receptor b isoform X2 [Gouania willdenowi]|uniref:Growth hormone receptor-like n=1 Tax=Gouania willdenowi TaxID=441366 RepID=A0A8C5GWB7_GOUWI|nr:growth hormone receptor-like isoform X2 [Gouania willdenowi]